MQGVVQTSVSAMAVVKGANLKDVPRVLKAVLISARHTVEESVAVGGSRDQSLVIKQLLRVINLQEGNQAFVLPTVLWQWTSKYKAVLQLPQHFKCHNPSHSEVRLHLLLLAWRLMLRLNPKLAW